jgi:hypothetical protein
MKSFDTVRIYPSRIEAEIARGLLETNGVKAFVTADDIGGIYPLTMTFGVELKVESEMLTKARNILKI